MMYQLLEIMIQGLIIIDLIEDIMTLVHGSFWTTCIANTGNR